MFPISIEGTIEGQAMGSAEAEQFLTNMEARLAKAKARKIYREAGRITFHAGIFRFVSNWNVLVQVSSGEIEVVPGSPGIVKYKFSLMELLIVAILMSGMYGFFMVSSPDFSSRLESALGAWLFLFGGNYVIALVRLPGFVRGAIQ